MSRLFDKIEHLSAGDYKGTCKHCGKTVKGYSKAEVTAKLDRHNKRSHAGAH